MKVLKFTISIILLTLVSNISFAEEREYRLEIKDFTELKVDNNLNVEYRCSADSAGLAFFKCEPEIAHMLLFTNNKSSLSVQIDDNFDYSVSLPTVRVYSTQLEKVENGSDSTVRVISNIPVQTFKARVIGNGSLVIDRIEATQVNLSVVTGHGVLAVSSGQVLKAKISDIGTGSIQAGGLKASQVRAYVSGTGNVDCCATESLSIYGMGSGSVYYSGNPSKVSNRSWGIKAIEMK